MLQRKVTNLALDPRSIDRDRLMAGSDGSFPGLITEASFLAPRLARGRMELAMTAVGEGAVIAQPASADAFEQPTQQVNVGLVLRSPTSGLGAADLLDARP